MTSQSAKIMSHSHHRIVFIHLRWEVMSIILGTHSSLVKNLNPFYLFICYSTRNRLEYSVGTVKIILYYIIFISTRIIFFQCGFVLSLSGS